MKRFCVLLVFAFLAACAPVRVQYDYEPGTAFSNYSTYALVEGLQTGLSELDERRLLEAVGRELQSKGFTLAEDPGLLLDIQSNIYQDPSQSSVGFGLGGTGRHMGGGVSVGVPLSAGQLQREIRFELIDPRRGRTLWQAFSQDRFDETATPLQREERFAQIAARVFAGFPPEK
jgi:hypothetical protein